MLQLEHHILPACVIRHYSTTITGKKIHCHTHSVTTMVLMACRCESEYRLCFDDDSQDLPIENQLEIWHSICDSRLTFSLTTPVVSNIITSFHPNFCNTAVSACDSGILSQSECSETYAGHGSASAFSSCLCQPKLLSLAYTCNVLGNISCQLTPGAVTNMPQYKLCTNLLEVLGTVGGHFNMSR